MPIIEGKLKLVDAKFVSAQARCTDKFLAIHWKDRRDVYMLTSMNTNEMVDTKKIDRKTGKKYGCNRQDEHVIKFYRMC